MARKRKKLKDFHDRLEFWRTDLLELSQQDFLRHLRPHLKRGITRTTLAGYEVDTWPKVDFLIALTSAFPRLSLPWLLFGEGGPLEDPTRHAKLGTRVGKAGAELAAPHLSREAILLLRQHELLELDPSWSLSGRARESVHALLTDFLNSHPDYQSGPGDIAPQLKEVARLLGKFLKAPYSLKAAERHCRDFNDLRTREQDLFVGLVTLAFSVVAKELSGPQSASGDAGEPEKAL